jgi:hypothetical protein
MSNQRVKLGCIPIVVTALGCASIAGLMAFAAGYDNQSVAMASGVVALVVLSLPLVVLLAALAFLAIGKLLD